MIDSILITIVIYNQQLENSISYKTICTSLRALNKKCTLFVYDNSGFKQDIAVDSDCFEIIYKHNPKNEGISKAYNESAVLAEKLEKKWLFFIDQDSEFPTDYIQTLEIAIKENNNINLFAPILKSGSIIVSPCWVFWEKGKMMKSPKPGIQNMVNKSYINSGLCVSLNAFKEVGGYNNFIRLDFSDHYFIKQFKKKFKKMYLIDTEVKHSLSTFSDSYDSQLNRFKFYCNGARNFSEFQNFIPLFIICSFRSIKLTVLSKNVKFLGTYLRYYIFGKKL